MEYIVLGLMFSCFICIGLILIDLRSLATRFHEIAEQYIEIGMRLDEQTTKPPQKSCCGSVKINGEEV